MLVEQKKEDDNENKEDDSWLYNFGEAIQIGSHQESIDKVISGEIDAAAIDSTVLETELETTRPNLLKDEIKIIHVLGPSPSPPFVINRIGLENAIRRQVDTTSMSSSSASLSQSSCLKELANEITLLIQEALTFSSSAPPHQNENDDDDDDEQNEQQQKREFTVLLKQRSEILKRYGLARFDKVSDSDYDVVREMLQHSLDFPQW